MVDSSTNSKSSSAGKAQLTAWAARAAELAEWVERRLVNRTDVWGGYVDLADVGKERTGADGKTFKLPASLTRPAKSKRGLGLVTLTRATIEAHFRALRRSHIIGVHAHSKDSLCRWVALDIDHHEPGGNDAEVNRKAALHWYAVLVRMGFKPLLYSSNGTGGYHLWVLLDAPIASEAAYWFVRWLTRDYAQFGYPKRPECSPKQKQVGGGKCPYGNWLRVIGRHHTKAHWPDVWNGERWLVGHEAVNHVLGLAGDPATLVPLDCELRLRIEPYLAKLPNLGEGQGRDDVAYTFAARLIRDMALDETTALYWLEQWDAKNTPPKGTERLKEIIVNVGVYGQRAYGSANAETPKDGQSDAPGYGPRPPGGSAAPEPEPATPPPPKPPPPEPQSGYAIILDHFRESYQPTFRRGTVLYSSALAREVKPGEATYAGGHRLLSKLAGATDAPRNNKGELEPQALPRFFATWSRSAWVDMLAALPEEEHAEECDNDAEDAFRRDLATVLLTMETLARRNPDTGQLEQERRSLVSWCRAFARPDAWGSIRSYRLWSRMKTNPGGMPQLQIALRVELLGQLRMGGSTLGKMSSTKFARLARMYGVAIDEDNTKVLGQRAIILTDAFINDMLENQRIDEHE